jgi:hypothetical protein
MLYVRDIYTRQRLSVFTSDKQFLSSKGVLHKDYDRKGLVAKKNISDHEPQEAWHQDELIGRKPPFIK